MATRTSNYQVWNEATFEWDGHLFVPAPHNHSAAEITNLTTDLAAKVSKAGDTMTGALTVPQVLLGYPIQNYNPFSSYKIMDSISNNLVAGKWAKLKVTWDGVENTNMARNLTDQNYEQYSGDNPHGIDGDADHILNIDFVTNGLYGANGVTYAFGTVVFNFYSTPFPSAWSCRWKNKDGVWSNITLVKNGGSLLVGEIPNSTYLTNIELTLSTGTGAPYVTSNIKWGLSEFEYYGKRMGIGQGASITSVGGYIGGNLEVAGALTKGAQPVVLNNDSRLTNARPASDVYAWAKAAVRPSYDWSDIGLRPTKVSDFTNDLGFITGNEADQDYAAKAHESATNNPHGVTTSQIGAEPSFAKNSAFNRDFGTGNSQVSRGDHIHGNLTSDGKLGGNAYRPVITDLMGKISEGAWATQAEAQAGTSETSFMSPKRVSEAISYMMPSGGVSVTSIKNWTNYVTCTGTTGASLSITANPTVGYIGLVWSFSSSSSHVQNITWVKINTAGDTFKIGVSGIPSTTGSTYTELYRFRVAGESTSSMKVDWVYKHTINDTAAEDHPIATATIYVWDVLQML